MSAQHRYIKSTNPFAMDDDPDDIDDETFLRNSRRSQPPPNNSTSTTAFDDQLQSFQERRRQIEDRTINSTENSLSVLRESEQIGVATAEELMRQREKLERTDKQLDEINATLRFSQKHINGIKSVFSSLKNYVSGRNGDTTQPPQQQRKQPQTTNNDITNNIGGGSSGKAMADGEIMANYDRFDNHPATRLRQLDYNNQQQQQNGGAHDFSAKLDANLQEMCSNISRLKGLASEMSGEIDSQNDLIGNIIDKTDRADLTIQKQSKDMNRLLKK